MHWSWTYGDHVVTLEVECLGFRQPFSFRPRAQYRATVTIDAGEPLEVDGFEIPYVDNAGDEYHDEAALSTVVGFFQAAVESVDYLARRGIDAATEADLGYAAEFLPVIAALKAAGIPTDYVLTDYTYEEVSDDE